MKNQLRSRERQGCGEVFTAGALWGTIGSFVLVMGANGSTSSLTAFLRVGFAFLIMAAATAVRFGLRAFRVDRRTLLRCALLGLLCHGIYNVFYSLAVMLTGVALSAVLLNVAPVFTAALSALFFAERITRRKAAALAVNVAGCVLAVTGGSFAGVQFSALGILCGIGAGFCYSLTAIIGRFAGENCNAFVMSTYSYFFAALFLAVWLRPWAAPLPLSGAVLGWGFLFALIPTAIAYVFYYLGVQKITESSRVPVIASVETAVAAVIGVAAYHEPLGAVNLAGIALVLGSIALMSGRGRQSSCPPEKTGV